MGADFWIMATLLVGAMLMMRVSARASVQAPRERPGHAYRQMLLDRAMRGDADAADEATDEAADEADEDAAKNTARLREPPPPADDPPRA